VNGAGGKDNNISKSNDNSDIIWYTPDGSDDLIDIFNNQSDGGNNPFKLEDKRFLDIYRFG